MSRLKTRLMLWAWWILVPTSKLDLSHPLQISASHSTISAPVYKELGKPPIHGHTTSLSKLRLMPPGSWDNPRHSISATTSSPIQSPAIKAQSFIKILVIAMFWNQAKTLYCLSADQRSSQEIKQHYGSLTSSLRYCQARRLSKAPPNVEICLLPSLRQF